MGSPRDLVAYMNGLSRAAGPIRRAGMAAAANATLKGGARGAQRANPNPVKVSAAMSRAMRAQFDQAAR